MPQEAEIATIPGAVLVPLDQIENGTAIEQVRELAAGKRLMPTASWAAAVPRP